MTAWQRVMTQFRVVVFYLSLLFWPAPSRLNLDHDVAISLSLFDPATTLFSLLFLAGLFATAVFTARREPLASYAILWFLGNLVIESSVIRLELIFDHRTYLPSVFPAMVLVSLVFRFLIRPMIGHQFLMIVQLTLGLSLVLHTTTSAAPCRKQAASKRRHPTLPGPSN